MFGDIIFADPLVGTIKIVFKKNGHITRYEGDEICNTVLYWKDSMTQEMLRSVTTLFEKMLLSSKIQSNFKVHKLVK